MKGRAQLIEDWTTSSYCGQTGDCVEVRVRSGEIVVRDSKDPDGPVLRFTPAEWRAFLAGARVGEFDLG
ncbi:MAG TPA: DUF397 domain-containing protein [Actinocrinis sp.]|nr:DUF397 domain-containing protein [Actinocrinis sp.]